ncbi:MAG TPA: YceI family protein [Bryobacteraceae bacterium]|nr:YceI family protein [Bryobacteraceae bacterium]
MTYQIDPKHSSAHFTVRHMMIASVRGRFDSVSGTVDFDPAKPDAGRFDATIDVNSLHTGDPQRDGHLKTPDFFDAAKYPTITFRSKKITPAGGKNYKATGDLTIRGVTKEATLNIENLSDEVTDPWKLQRRGVGASTKVSRKDFGLAFDPDGAMVSDTVEITLDIEMTRAAS